MRTHFLQNILSSYIRRILAYCVCLLAASIVSTGFAQLTPVKAADIWTEITDDVFSQTNQEIRDLTRFADFVLFTTKSTVKPLDLYIYYANELLSITTEAPFILTIRQLELRSSYLWKERLL